MNTWQTTRREIRAYRLEGDNNYSIFEVHMHDGYVKRFNVSANDCLVAQAHERDVLEDLIRAYYEDTEGSAPQMLIFFS